MRDSADFTLAVRHGRRVRRGSVVAHVVLSPTGPGPASAPAKVGFVVAKTVGNSVVRHRVSRRLRAVVAPQLAAWPPAATVVIRALPTAADASSRALASDVAAALERFVAATP